MTADCDLSRIIREFSLYQTSFMQRREHFPSLFIYAFMVINTRNIFI